ncbi:YeeE/YedE family protein [Paracoccus luteus]|uniref:YeeE/YedE family protein n=1 Tax=Paracoccus luteus TaxID=2508543 RepID=UPI001070405B|nr:YeeE/YedE thiosulfate transporter family protein [Paracoccus luteus]
MPLDWLLGLLGGLMIGAAAAVFLIGMGQVMGASGLIAGLIAPAPSARRAERAAFVAGLVLVPALLVQLGPGPAFAPVVGWPVLILAGLLVGFGSRLANGCTSGHGVCGVSRLAPRGIAATLTYVASGVAGVLLARWAGWA